MGGLALATKPIKKPTFKVGFFIGAQVEQVDEPPITFVFELEAFPEPKALSSTDLKELYEVHKSYQKVAGHIGASEAFVRQKSQNKAYKKKTKTKGDL